LSFGTLLTVQQQILAYGIDHGLSHARQAVEEAELAIKTHGNDHDQVAKLFGLAQRTLASIESQEPAMEKLRQAEESSDGVERVKKLIKEHTQKVEQGQEQHSSQESVKPNHAAWNFKQQK
jgi:ABC-type transport system involved in cytochrome bd biosynthesis fused ATPase/permease subunit